METPNSGRGGAFTVTATTRVDLHVKVLDEAVVKRAKRRGVDVLVYAPHFTRWPDIRERAAHFSDDDLLVVPGREVFTGDWTTRRHILALDLSAPIPDFISLEGAMAELDRQDAVILVPHPGFLTVSLGADEIDHYRDKIAGVELYNPKLFPWNKNEATGIADNLDIPGFASSYAHLKHSVGEAWTVFEGRIETEAELLTALREGTPRHIEHREGLRHRAQCGLEFAHLGWENSWEKVDRVYLSGTEATHPGHVAYEGKFDDVRVY